MKTLVRVALVMFVLSAISTTAIEQKPAFGGPVPLCPPGDNSCGSSNQSTGL